METSIDSLGLIEKASFRFIDIKYLLTEAIQLTNSRLRLRWRQSHRLYPPPRGTSGAAIHFHSVFLRESSTELTVSCLRTGTGSKFPRKCSCGFQIPEDPKVRYVVNVGQPWYVLAHHSPLSGVCFAGAQLRAPPCLKQLTG